MITVIVTSYKEPKATVHAVKTILKQKISEKFKVVVSDPFPEVEEFLRKEIKDKRVQFFLDPGMGKAYALNLIFQKFGSKNKNDLMIFTDGDVFLAEGAMNEIIETFKDREIGGITGRPFSTNSRETKYGYWSKLLYSGIDMVRNKIHEERAFFQCSGYLFAIRNGIIGEIPIDVPEDCIIPYLIWKEGYKIAYVSTAAVNVKYPDNWKDWVNQRVRTIKAHENISKLYPDMPRTKSFLNEIKQGLVFSLLFPNNMKEFLWTLQLFLARVYVYRKSFNEIKNKKVFSDGWRETEIHSTKLLD